MKKYALFGGTFDPFTKAHRAIVKALLEKKDANGKNFIDKVFVAPTIVEYYRSDKKKWLTDDWRKKVITTFLSDLDYGIDWQLWEDDLKLKELCKDSDDEVKSAILGNHRFINTLLNFKAAICQPDDEVYVVIGSDSLQNFKTWHLWKEILKQAKLIVVDGRYGEIIPKDDEIPYEVLNISEDYAFVSGSKVREKYEAKGLFHYIESIKQTVRSETFCKLLHTPIFDVGTGLKTETGLKPILIKAPDWMTIIVEKDGKFLIEKQYRYGAMSIATEFPCGIVEEGEDPLDTAVRELEEETGIKIKNKECIVKLGETNPNPAFMTNKMHYFYVDLSKAQYVKVDTKLDEHEKITSYWVDKSLFIDSIVDETQDGLLNNVPAMLLSALYLLLARNVSLLKAEIDEAAETV